jgi:hypothetical protein
MKVNAIIYVSANKGKLIDSGVSGISGFVEEEQQLFNKEFELKHTPLHHKVIELEYWADYPEYQKIRTLTVAIVHDKYKSIDVPFFPIESLNEAKIYRDKMNKEIEESCEYALFHMGGPLITSSNGDSQFFLNDSEMILLHYLFMTVYNFKDSFKNTKDFLNKIMVED